MQATTDRRPWRTITEYYDRENGEQITKSLMEREYVKMKQLTPQYKEDGNFRYKVHIYECERNRQQELKF